MELDKALEKKKLAGALLFPTLMLLAMWLVELAEWALDLDFGHWGIYPRSWAGLPGIALAPFLHGDWSHLAANSGPVFFLSLGVFYFHRRKAWGVLLALWLTTGLWVWASARPAFHIGASGLLYALATFLFTSGLLTRDRQQMAVSLLVVFLYGGIIWGILPDDPKVSWESHLMGALAGVLVALFFRDPRPKTYPDGPPPDFSAFSDTRALDGFQYNYTETDSPPKSEGTEPE